MNYIFKNLVNLNRNINLNKINSSKKLILYLYMSEYVYNFDFENIYELDIYEPRDKDILKMILKKPKIIDEYVYIKNRLIEIINKYTDKKNN